MNTRGLVASLGVSLMIAAALLTTVSVDAEEPAGSPDWIYTKPRLESLEDYDKTDFSHYIHGNMPRENVTADIWYHHQGPWNSYDIKRQYSTVATRGETGFFSDRYVLPFGESQWHMLDLSPFPKSFVHYNSGTNGVAILTYAYQNYYGGTPKFMYSKNVLSVFGRLDHDPSSNIASAKNIVRRKNKEMDFTLTHDDKSPVTDVSSNGMTFSKNGKWMYMPSRITGKMRFNTEDFSVMSFARATNPGVQIFTAVSNSGRFVVELDGWRNLTIYDLERCEAEKPNFAPRNCQSRVLTTNFRDQLKANLSDPTKFVSFSPNEIKFKDEATLEGLLTVQYDGQRMMKKFVYKVDPGAQPQKYLALGDSFSSGQGTYNYRPETDFYKNEGNYNLCHQSTKSYPYVLHAALSFDDFGSVACSGAKMVNVNNSSTNDYVQAYGLDMEKSTDKERVQRLSLPGYLSQSDHIKHRSSSVATVSIGGNDIGFQDIVTSCVLSSNCYSRRDDRERLANAIDGKIMPLSSTLKTIKENLSGEQKLYVVGYPQIASVDVDSKCATNVDLSLTERGFARDLINYLNAAIKTAANNAGAFYVDVSYAFEFGGKNYQLCGDQNTLAVNGLLQRSWSTQQGFVARYIANTESFHPNILGHLLLANAIRSKTDDLTTVMPEPNSSAISHVGDNLRANLVGDTDRRLVGSVDYDSRVLEKSIFKYDADKTSNSLKYKINGSKLPPKDGKINIKLHSDPVDLGTFNVEQDGTVNANLVIPESVPVGYHELHLTYTDMTDSVVDIFQVVFVGHSPDDIDGDGIKNEEDRCLLGDEVCLPDEPATEDLSEAGVSQVNEAVRARIVDESVARKVMQGVSATNFAQPTSNGEANTPPSIENDVRENKPEAASNIQGEKSVENAGKNDSKGDDFLLPVVVSVFLVGISTVFLVRRKA